MPEWRSGSCSCGSRSAVSSSRTARRSSFGWWGGGGLRGTAGWLGSSGFRPPLLMAALVALSERPACCSRSDSSPVRRPRGREHDGGHSQPRALEEQLLEQQQGIPVQPRAVGGGGRARGHQPGPLLGRPRARLRQQPLGDVVGDSACSPVSLASRMFVLATRRKT